MPFDDSSYVTHRVRKFPTYNAALAVAYEEEASGLAYWTSLAGQHEGRQREALQLMVRIHELTLATLGPLVEKHRCSVFTAHGMERQGNREAAVVKAFEWPRLLQRLQDEHAPFIIEFHDLVAAGPDEDRPMLGLVAAAGEAIVEFARRESAGDVSSLQPLTQVIERLESR